jgi:hypothetical protein
LAYYGNPTPIMVTHHFDWVGKGKRPAILNIAGPHDYKNPDKKPVVKW